MKKAIMILLAVAAVAAVLFWVVKGRKPTVSEARVDFCGNLKDYGEAVVSLRSIDQNSTVEELQNAQMALQDSWEDLQKSSNALKEAKLDALETSYHDLESTIQNIPDQMTLAEAKTEIYLAALNTLANTLAADQVTCRFTLMEIRGRTELP
jgi:hypothetical protein